MISFNVYGAYNFGILVDNNEYQIYRSEALGKPGLKYLRQHLKNIKMPFPKTIIYMNNAGYGGPFTFATEEVKLQGEYGYKFYHMKGDINTYLDGHDPRYPRDDVDHDGKKDGGLDTYYKILDIVLDKNNQPVLFHCFGGRHRTGIIALSIRYLQGGDWLKGYYRKFVFPRMLVHLNAAGLEYAHFNTALFRLGNIRFIQAESKEERFNTLRNNYQTRLNL